MENIDLNVEYCEFSDEEEVFGLKAQCRICHELDFVEKMVSPCECRGSIKFAHTKCIQDWCNEKASATCEICHKTYQRGYTALPASPPLAADARYQIPILSDMIWANFPNSRSSILMNVSPAMFRPVVAPQDECDPDDGENENAEDLAHFRRFIMAQLVVWLVNAMLMVLLILRAAYIHNTDHEISEDEETKMVCLVGMGMLLNSFIASLLPYCWKSSEDKNVT